MVGEDSDEFSWVLGCVPGRESLCIYGCMFMHFVRVTVGDPMGHIMDGTY